MTEYSSNCFVCKRIDDIIAGVNPYFVKETTTGYVVLCDFQLYRGYTIFLSRTHVQELHQLDEAVRIRFLQEMSEVAFAVYCAFKPRKMNYELLGNTDSHMHWHLIPRYEDDPKPETAIWAIDKSIRCADAVRPSSAAVESLKQTLLRFL